MRIRWFRGIGTVRVRGGWTPSVAEAARYWQVAVIAVLGLWMAAPAGAAGTAAAQATASASGKSAGLAPGQAAVTLTAGGKVLRLTHACARLEMDLNALLSAISG